MIFDSKCTKNGLSAGALPRHAKRTSAGLRRRAPGKGWKKRGGEKEEGEGGQRRSGRKTDGNRREGKRMGGKDKSTVYALSLI